MPRTRDAQPEPVHERLAQAKAIGERIRTHRLSMGLTQLQVAEPEYTKAYISALETGIARPSMRALSIIAERLNCVPSDLVDDDRALPTGESLPSIVWVRVGDDRLYAELHDGRDIGVALKDPALRGMRVSELAEWRIGLGGQLVIWPKTGARIGVQQIFGLREAPTAPAPSPTEIADRIRSARQERGLTQAQVAGTRFSVGYIKALENERAAPSLPALSYIADRLRIRRSDLLGGVRSRPTEAGPVLAESARVMDGRLYVAVADGRDIGIPLELVPKLLAAPMDAVARWSIARGGAAVRWSALGLEILIEEYSRPSLEVG